MPEEQGYKSPEVAGILREKLIIDEFIQSDAWALIQKLFKKEVMCIANAMLNDRKLHKDPQKVLIYQTRAEIFGNFIPFLFKRLQEEGDIVIDSLNEAGISLEDIF